MRKVSVTVLISIAILAGGCGHNKFHQGSMPDPATKQQSNIVQLSTKGPEK